MEEVAVYRQQLATVCQQIEQLGNEQEHSETISHLHTVRSDLQELIALMESELGEDVGSTCAAGDGQNPTDSIGPVEGEMEPINDVEFLDEMLGSRCRAPYTNAQLPVSLHAAIVFEYDPPSSSDDDITVRVLFSHPMLPAMKPCQHFLKGTCKFDSSCRFSHGEAVPLSSLELYEEPDFNAVQVGGLVLVKSNDVWELGRIVQTDFTHCEMAVKLLKSSKEVCVPFDETVPLKEVDAQLEKDASSPIHVPEHVLNDELAEQASTSQWSELKGTSHGRVSTGELGDWNGGGFGLKLMQKMGYKVGQGLGKRSDGIVHAVQASVLPKNKSLDYVMENKHKVKVVDGKEMARNRVEKQLKGARTAAELDIFSFLNRKLESKPAESDKEHDVREKFALSRATEKSLVEQVIDGERKIKELKSKEKKLKEGISRNKGDKKTVERLQTALEQVRRELQREESRQGRVQSEKDRRNKNKDLF